MAKKANSADEAMPVEVEILTKDHEIRGIVYVSREQKEKRRLSDLLNDQERRFLAITDVSLINREGPSTPRHYSFLEVHLDNIIMLHPSAESVAKGIEYTADQSKKFERIREKINRPAPAEK